jgi:glycine betaine transporter
VISGPFEGFNLPAGLLAITQAMPMGFILSLLFLVLTMIFVATTSDSMSFVIAASMSNENPSAALRAFWGMAMAVMALILIGTGGGGVGKLQSFIVVTAVPVSLVLLPSLWDALRITLALGRK